MSNIKKVVKAARKIFGLLILVAMVTLFAFSLTNLSKDTIGFIVGLFLLVVLPFGNIGYSMVFKKPEEGSFSPFTLYVYGLLIGLLGIYGAIMGEPLALWSLGFSAGCFQLAISKKKALNKTTL